MIKYYTRKPVRDFLNKVTEPPYSLPIDEQNRCFESILEIYEESTNKERQNFLCTDTFDLLRAFIEEWRAINPKDPKDIHRLSMIAIRFMLSTLIAAANQYGVRLPESEIKRYEKVDFGICSFAKFVRDTYNPIEPIQAKQKAAQTTANNRGKQAGTSKPATDGSNIQKQPATSTGDTLPKSEKTTVFTDCIANDYRDKQAIIEAELRKVLNGKKGKAAIIVFVACYIHGILRQCPSHQQALFLSESIGKDHTGYNRQKKLYFSESEEGKRTNGNTATYDVIVKTKIDTIREEIIKAEAELKTLFDPFEIVTGNTATDGGKQLTSASSLNT